MQTLRSSSGLCGSGCPLLVAVPFLFAVSISTAAAAAAATHADGLSGAPRSSAFACIQIMVDMQLQWLSAMQIFSGAVCDSHVYT